MLDDIKERMFFDRDYHLRARNIQASDTSDEASSDVSESDKVTGVIPACTCNQGFKRRFENPDMATCWLNSCLQIVALCHGSKFR